MKELIKQILREEVQKRFVKSNQNIERTIIKVMENLISESTRIVIPPEDNYGNLNEEWCRGGKVVLEARYYFNSDDDDYYGETEKKFYDGSLFVNEEDVNFLAKMLHVRKSYILNVITEWYDEKYATKFGQETGHPELEIDETSETDWSHKCYEIVNTDNLSREEMIDYIDTQTLHKASDLEKMSDNELTSKYRSVYNSKNRE
jgi:hypothetical protein